MEKRQRTKHVPEEITEEILTNLPVKSLLRFKSVSKSWRSLISTKTFTNAHLKKSSINHHRLMICSRDYRSGNHTLSLRSSSLKSLLKDLKFQDYSPIPSSQHPRSDGYMTIVGSCNGLILLDFLFSSDLILWNPSTKQVNNNIPPPPKEYNCVGFAYDDSIDDYKIVTIFISNDDDALETHMYSLKTNSWKKIHDSYINLSYPMDGESGKYLNGKLHWEGRCGNMTTEIVCFDLAKGKYDFMYLPQEYNPYIDDGNYHLDVLGGYLCLVGFADVWFMKEYGDPESWTSTRILSYSGIPKWLAQNGDVSVARYGSKLIIYDRRNKLCMSRVSTSDIYDHCTYVETLVSPFGRQDIGQ